MARDVIGGRELQPPGRHGPSCRADGRPAAALRPDQPGATLTTPSGWTVLRTVSDGTDVRSWVLTRAATAGLAGSNLTLTLDATSKTSVALLAYSGAGAPSALTSRAETSTATRTHAAPAAAVANAESTVLRYYVDKGATAHTWTLSPTLVQRASHHR